MDILHLADYFGITMNDAVLFGVGIIALLALLIILMLIHVIQMHKLKKRYKIFMQGENAKSLEKKMAERLETLDEEIKVCEENAKNTDDMMVMMRKSFQKIGLVKYDAFQEMGGKLSFSLALLTQKDDGFVISVVHSREGCYTYIKEIVDGESVLPLSEDEKESLNIALES